MAFSFDLNLNPFYSVKVNLLDDANDSIIFSIDGALSRCTCIKSLSSVMVDPISDKVLLNLENNLSGSEVITGNVIRIFSNIWTFGKIFCQPRPFRANAACHALWSENGPPQCSTLDPPLYGSQA